MSHQGRGNRVTVTQRDSTNARRLPSFQSCDQQDEESSGASPYQTRNPSPVADQDIFVGRNAFTDRPLEAFRELISRCPPCRDDEERPEKASKQRKTCSLTQPGCGIWKVVDLYHNLNDLVDKARKLDTRSMLESQESDTDRNDFVGLKPDEIEEEKKDREHCHKALQLLNSLVPGFEQNAIASGNTSTFYSPLQNGANDAQSDDTCQLKAAVADWLNSRLPLIGESSSDTRISPRAKEERGINHNITGRLLCLIDYNWDDLEVHAKLRNCAPGYDFNSNFFLWCLYEQEDGDPLSPEVGFLKGPLLLRTFHHISTSPSSAGDENSSSEVTSRRCDVASTLRMHGQVTARSIAYTATQLTFSLNSAREWKHEHAGFHYPSFYNFVVDLLEDEDKSTRLVDVDELFRWWNSRVFPPAINRTSTASRNAIKSSVERLKQAHARVERHAF